PLRLVLLRPCTCSASAVACRRSPTPLLLLFQPTPPTEIYTLSLHDALPILAKSPTAKIASSRKRFTDRKLPNGPHRVWSHNKAGDRKSTRLNSSHVSISYAVFCLKKKKKVREKTVPTCTRATRTDSSAGIKQ